LFYVQFLNATPTNFISTRRGFEEDEGTNACDQRNCCDDVFVGENHENSIRAVSVGRFRSWGIRHDSSVESNEKRRRENGEKDENEEQR
jgi:hypothetical protein